MLNNNTNDIKIYRDCNITATIVLQIQYGMTFKPSHESRTGKPTLSCSLESSAIKEIQNRVNLLFQVDSLIEVCAKLLAKTQPWADGKILINFQPSMVVSGYKNDVEPIVVKWRILKSGGTRIFRLPYEPGSLIKKRQLGKNRVPFEQSKLVCQLLAIVDALLVFRKDLRISISTIRKESLNYQRSTRSKIDKAAQSLSKITERITLDWVDGYDQAMDAVQKRAEARSAKSR